MKPAEPRTGCRGPRSGAYLPCPPLSSHIPAEVTTAMPTHLRANRATTLERGELLGQPKAISASPEAIDPRPTVRQTASVRWSLYNHSENAVWIAMTAMDQSAIVATVKITAMAAAERAIRRATETCGPLMAHRPLPSRRPFRPQPHTTWRAPVPACACWDRLLIGRLAFSPEGGESLPQLGSGWRRVVTDLYCPCLLYTSPSPRDS